MQRISNKKLKDHCDLNFHYTGCTANICLLTPNKLYNANVGDSRAIALIKN